MGLESGLGATGAPQIIGGVAAHMYGNLAETSPAANAQRRLFKDAKRRAIKGDYGFSNAQKGQETAFGNQQVAAQQAQAQADIARAAAAGGLDGGAATEATRAVAQQAQAAQAQNAAQVQARSDQYAMAQRAGDEARIDAQADRVRKFWDKQAQISLQTTQGQAPSLASQVTPSDMDANAKYDAVFGNKAKA